MRSAPIFENYSNVVSALRRWWALGMLLLAQSNLVQVRDVLQLVEMLIGTQFLASQWSISNVLSICWLLRSQTLQVRQLAFCMLCITEFLLIAVEPRLCRCSWLQSASSCLYHSSFDSRENHCPSVWHFCQFGAATGANDNWESVRSESDWTFLRKCWRYAVPAIVLKVTPVNFLISNRI